VLDSVGSEGKCNDWALCWCFDNSYLHGKKLLSSQYMMQNDGCDQSMSWQCIRCKGWHGECHSTEIVKVGYNIADRSMYIDILRQWLL